MARSIDILLAGWQKNLEQTEALLDGIASDQMTRQPAGAPNHPAWTIAHLLHYHPAILSLIDGKPVNDPAEHPDASRYDAGSTPVDEPQQYPSKDELIANYPAGHEQVTSQLRQVSEDQLDRAPGLPRWAKAFPSIAATLTYLMVVHEATHLGQIMTWRRAMGWPPLG